MIGEGIRKALRQSGYSVDWVQDGEDVEPCLSSEEYDLLILDLGIPNKDGVQILKSLRQQENKVTILILTARDSIQDRVAGLDAGADEYMIKPFSLDELEARIRLLLRRSTGQKTNLLEVDGLSINVNTNEVIYLGGHYTLSAKEFALMHLLMKNPTHIFSRAKLEEKLYGWNEEVESNSIEVHIHQIRKKMGKGIIQNTRNVGYSIGVEA